MFTELITPILTLLGIELVPFLLIIIIFVCVFKD